MTPPNSSGAGKPENSNSLILRPIYTLKTDPHKDHRGFVLKLREKNGWVWDILYCEECNEEYILHFEN
jgi:hypothetical protein